MTPTEVLKQLGGLRVLEVKHYPKDELGKGEAWDLVTKGPAWKVNPWRKAHTENYWVWYRTPTSSMFGLVSPKEVRLEPAPHWRDCTVDAGCRGTVLHLVFPSGPNQTTVPLCQKHREELEKVLFRDRHKHNAPQCMDCGLCTTGACACEKEETKDG